VSVDEVVVVGRYQTFIISWPVH